MSHTAPLRLVLLCTPRAGSNWLRNLLCRIYNFSAAQVPCPDEVDWKGLPSEHLLALHWHPVPPFLDLLREHGFRPLVLTRHPLDALISVLHFARHYADEAATRRWLEGEGGSEEPIYSAMPRSTAFLDYATGPRAGALLSVSREWWQVPGTVRVRYEDLVADPEAELRRLTAEIGVPPRQPIGEAVGASTIPKLREATQFKEHFWQGKSGLWRSLLPMAEAQHIAAAHTAVFRDLDYVCDPDPNLDASRADANWVQLVWPELRRATQTRLDMAERLAEVQRRYQELESAYRHVETAYRDVVTRLEETQARQAEAERVLSTVKYLAPGAVPLSRAMLRWYRSRSRFSSLVKWIGRRGPTDESRPAA